MIKAEFDEFASTYIDVASGNARFFESDYDYFARYRAKLVREIAKSNIGSILDFGCGVGLGIQSLREQFPNASIVGCDPSQESLALARKREPDHEFFAAEEIPAAAQRPRRYHRSERIPPYPASGSRSRASLLLSAAEAPGTHGHIRT